MGALTVADVNQWYKVITDFPAYYQNFNLNLNALLAQGPYLRAKHPGMLPEYNQRVNNALKLRAQLETVRSAVEKMRSMWETVTSWLRNVTMTAEQKAYETRPTRGVDGLGILPVVWGGIAAGAALGVLAAVGNWLTETKIFAARVEEAKRLEAAGRSPEEINEILKGRFGDPGTGGTFFGVPIKAIFYGILALAAIPFITQLMKRK